MKIRTIKGTRGYVFKTKFLSLETLQLFAKYFDKYEFWMYDTPDNHSRFFFDDDIILGSRKVGCATIYHKEKEIWVCNEYDKTEQDFKRYLEKASSINRIPDLDNLLENGWYFNALKKYRKRKYRKLIKLMRAE